MKKIALLPVIIAALFFFTEAASAQKNKAVSKEMKADRDADGVPDAEDSCPDVAGANNPGARGCPDRDNDYVTDDQDKCPDVPGLGRYMGCPDDPDPALKLAMKQQAIRDSISIDSLRQLFYPVFDKANTYAERAAALREFKENIIKVTGGTGYDNMRLAIKPVMQTRTLGKPELGDQVATIWENGQLYKTTILSMMNKKDQEYLEQLSKDQYEAWKKSEAERILAANTPPPATPRTKEEECQQKLYDTQQGRGGTYFYNNDLVIMESYDCATDLYTMWRPRQGNDGNMEPKGKRIQVRPEWGRWSPAVLKKYHRCSECAGEGDVLLVTYDTKTKDLPQGYFSGVQTTKTTTTKKTTKQSCHKCNGLGWLLY